MYIGEFGRVCERRKLRVNVGMLLSIFGSKRQRMEVAKGMWYTE